MNKWGILLAAVGALGNSAWMGHEIGATEAVRSRGNGWESGRLLEPRQLIDRETGGQSRISSIRILNTQGRVTLMNASLGADETVLLTATPENPSKTEYRIWLDPRRNYMPLQIEESHHGRIDYLYDSIVYEQVQPGVWFPVSGVLHQLERYDEKHLGKVRATVTLNVEPASIELKPAITEQSFRLNLPVGTSLHDEVLNESFVVVDDELDYFADVVKAATSIGSTSRPSNGSGSSASAASRAPTDDGTITTPELSSSLRNPAWLLGLTVLGCCVTFIYLHRRSRKQVE